MAKESHKTQTLWGGSWDINNITLPFRTSHLNYHLITCESAKRNKTWLVGPLESYERTPRLEQIMYLRWHFITLGLICVHGCSQLYMMWRFVGCNRISAGALKFAKSLWHVSWYKACWDVGRWNVANCFWVHFTYNDSCACINRGTNVSLDVY